MSAILLSILLTSPLLTIQQPPEAVLENMLEASESLDIVGAEYKGERYITGVYYLPRVLRLPEIGDTFNYKEVLEIGVLNLSGMVIEDVSLAKSIGYIPAAVSWLELDNPDFWDDVNSIVLSLAVIIIIMETQYPALEDVYDKSIDAATAAIDIASKIEERDYYDEAYVDGLISDINDLGRLCSQNANLLDSFMRETQLSKDDREFFNLTKTLYEILAEMCSVSKSELKSRGAEWVQKFYQLKGQPKVTITIDSCPKETETYSEFTVQVRVLNEGYTKARNVAVKVEGPEWLEVKSSETIPRLNPGEWRVVNITLYAGAGSKPGSYTVKFKTSYKDLLGATKTSYWTKSVNIKFKEVRKPALSLSLSKTSINLSVGGKTRITLTCTNGGNADAQQAAISAESNLGLNPQSVEIGAIGVGESRTYEFEVQGTTEGTHKIVFHVSYKDQAGKDYTGMAEVTVNVMRPSTIALSVTPSELAVEEGAIANFTVEVENTGGLKATGISLTVYTPAGLEQTSTLAPIDSLEPGEKRTFQVSLRVLSAGEYSVKITATYIDPLEGGKSGDTVMVIRATKPGIALPTWLIAAGAIVVAAIIIAVLLKGKRRGEVPPPPPPPNF